MSVRDLDIAAAEEDTDEARILCARCYSLSHYGCALCRSCFTVSSNLGFRLSMHSVVLHRATVVEVMTILPERGPPCMACHRSGTPDTGLYWLRQTKKIFHQFHHGGVHVRCRRIKSQRAEAALPQFDLGRKVGRKIGLQKLRRAVVLVVVDAADFDGSLPRAALEGLFANIEGYQVRRGACSSC